MPQGAGTPNGADFHPLNVPALAPTLVESELFGHCKGAFTGAVRDQPGWLEECSLWGTVFLDEIGELDPAVQVKLLRVVQERTFHRLGETRTRNFEGKIITATNRDLAAEMRARRFREDLYYRLCSDMITTPSLGEQLSDRPDDLPNLLRFIVQQLTATGVDEIANEVEHWILKHPRLGRNYGWPGNFRELEQCVWNVLIRKEYHPALAAPASDPLAELADAVRTGSMTADDLEGRYFALVFARTGSYQETSRQLGRNWRTVKSKINQEFLQRLQKDGVGQHGQP